MTCTSCMTSGNNLGCPCQDSQKAAGSNKVYYDACTGETKTQLPYVQGPAPQQAFDVVAVGVVPKKVQPTQTRQPCQQRMTCKTERKSPCYTCGPPRADPYPADHRCWKQVWGDAFQDYDLGTTKHNLWNSFSNLIDFTAGDGHHIQNKNGLVIMASEFKVSYDPKNDNGDYLEVGVDGFWDRFKRLDILNNDIPVPECGEVYYEVCAAGTNHNVKKHPFGSDVIDAEDDLRLAHSGPVMLDFDSGLIIRFALTNRSIWAIYEKLPIASDDSDEESGSVSFGYAFWLTSRNYKCPSKDYARLGLAIDKKKTEARWYIDGVLFHTQKRLGFPGDPKNALYLFCGEPKLITPECVHVGLGLFTMLDAVQPDNAGDRVAAGCALVRLTNCNYAHPLSPHEKVEFANETYDKRCRLFGQGATLRVKSLTVEYRR